MHFSQILFITFSLILVSACADVDPLKTRVAYDGQPLTELEYRVTRQDGTEPP